MDTNYSKLPTLENIYLEDSWIRQIDESLSRLRFTLDAVLTETHPEYTAPKPGGQYCYGRGILTFDNVKSFKWANKNLEHVNHDPDGSTDHGNLDVLGITKDGYHVNGEFGQVEITTDTPPTFILHK